MAQSKLYVYGLVQTSLLIRFAIQILELSKLQIDLSRRRRLQAYQKGS